jgi:hypothetical protein
MLTESAHLSTSARQSMQQISDQLDIMTDDEFGVISGAAKVTRATWRRDGVGPKFLKIGRRIFYRRTEVLAWFASREARTTAEQKMRARERATASL